MTDWWAFGLFATGVAGVIAGFYAIHLLEIKFGRG